MSIRDEVAAYVAQRCHTGDIVVLLRCGEVIVRWADDTHEATMSFSASLDDWRATRLPERIAMFCARHSAHGKEIG